MAKPNGGSQGKGVYLAHTELQLRYALRSIFKIDRVALVQRFVRGSDYRLVVLDKKVISAYRRIPLNVTGDGKSSILQLLDRKQREFVSGGRDTHLHPEDPRITLKLRKDGLTLHSILPKGKQVFLLDNANLSSGGDAEDITDSLHQDFKRIAIRLAKDMGLRLCGVDMMIDGDIQKAPKKYWIIEINSAPGLDHYATTGRAQQRMVEDLYLEVLNAMSKH